MKDIFENLSESLKQRPSEQIIFISGNILLVVGSLVLTINPVIGAVSLVTGLAMDYLVFYKTLTELQKSQEKLEFTLANTYEGFDEDEHHRPLEKMVMNNEDRIQELENNATDELEHRIDDLEWRIEELED